MRNTVQVTSLRRACGFRKANGIYVSTKTSEIGSPIEYFLVDPPQPIYVEDFPSLSAQGLHAVDASWRGKPGVYDIFDWVGKEYYPYVPDFVEEARLFGTSRQAQPSFPFAKLTDESRHFFLHSRASLIDPTKPYDNFLGVGGCPKRIGIHMEQPQLVYEMCTGLLWEVVGKCSNIEKRVHTVSMPCSINNQKFTYTAAATPQEWKLEWQLAIFMWMKPTCIEVIYDDINELHLKALSMLEKLGTGLPYYLVEE